VNVRCSPSARPSRSPTSCGTGSYTEIRSVGMVLGPPKSRAGHRTVSLPPVNLSAIRDHPAEYVEEDPTSPVFTVEKIGKPGLHFHDLRSRKKVKVRKPKPASDDHGQWHAA